MRHLNKWKISLYLAAIFLAGAVTGAFVASHVLRHKRFGPPHQDEIAAHWCKELTSKLNLTPVQVEKIKPIIDYSLTDFRTAFTTHIFASVSNANARIAQELTAEQKTRFEEIIKEQQAFMRATFKTDEGSPSSQP